MKLSRFSESQIINILKQTETGAPAPSLCREHGMTLPHFINGVLNIGVWMRPW